MTSINLGQPLVHSDSSSKIAQEIRRLARVIMSGAVPVAEPAPKRPFWSSLMRREQPQLDLQTTWEGCGREADEYNTYMINFRPIFTSPFSSPEERNVHT